MDLLAYILHRRSRKGFADSLAPMCAGDALHLMAQTQRADAAPASAAQGAFDALMGR